MSELFVKCNGLSKLCRLCLAADPPILFDIHSFSKEINLNISEVIMRCAPVQIYIEDKLPNVICNPCYQILIAISEFQKMIFSSEQTLLLYLKRLENRDCRNTDIQKSHLDIKTESSDTTVNDEDDCDDSLGQLKYNIGNSKIHLYNAIVDGVKNRNLNSVPFDAKKECQSSNDQKYVPSENFGFCAIDDIDQGGSNTEVFINECIDEDSADFSETKVYLQTALDENLKKQVSADLKQNVLVDDEVNEFSLSDTEINGNIDTADQYNSHRKSTLKKFKVKNNADAKSRYQCNECDKVFVKSKDLNNHKRVHSGKKPHKCDMCEKRFAQLSNLVAHKRSHTGEKPYKCDMCDSSFSRFSCLKRHKRTHTGEKPYKCDLCDKSFSRPCGLTTHKRSHTNEKPYQCELCGKSFSQSTNLFIHKRIHTGEKPYKCGLCDKSFSSSDTLNRHTRTHTGEKPYKCEICGTNFARYHNLVTHQRIHTGEKPYKCDFCGKGFSDRSGLVRHTRIHTGEKPYQCKLCDKSFSQSTSLITHKRSHTDVI